MMSLNLLKTLSSDNFLVLLYQPLNPCEQITCGYWVNRVWGLVLGNKTTLPPSSLRRIAPRRRKSHKDVYCKSSYYKGISKGDSPRAILRTLSEPDATSIMYGVFVFLHFQVENYFNTYVLAAVVYIWIIKVFFCVFFLFEWKLR